MTDAETAIQAAWAAHARLDWADAIVHWRACIAADPKVGVAYWMGGNLLLEAGRLDEAEAVLAAGQICDPGHIPIALLHAKVATARRDWSTAITRWNDLIGRAPDDPDVLAGRAAAEMTMRMFRLDPLSGHALAGEEWDRFAASASNSADRALLSDFESLGDNCEFGLVQRHFGAEPLSLFRWNAIGLDALVRGLAERFGTLGDIGQSGLFVDANGEYILQDHRYGMVMHTFIRAADVAGEDQSLTYARLRRRSAYLAQKLIEDLESPSRVFVVKDINGVSLDRVRALYTALRRFGPNTLLFVTEADAARPVGSVERIAPGLLIGAVHHFVRGADWNTIDAPGWRAVCAAARPLAEPTG